MCVVQLGACVRAQLTLCRCLWCWNLGTTDSDNLSLIIAVGASPALLFCPLLTRSTNWSSNIKIYFRKKTPDLRYPEYPDLHLTERQLLSRTTNWEATNPHLIFAYVNCFYLLKDLQEIGCSFAKSLNQGIHANQKHNPKTIIAAKKIWLLKKQ